jgi:hypothetical protein
MRKTWNPFTLMFYRRRIFPRLDVRGWARVSAYLLFLSILSSVLVVRSVIADTKEAAAQFGRDLLPLVGVLGEPQAVVVNGALFFVGAKHVDLPVSKVLDRVEEYCTEHAGHFEDEFVALPESERAKLSKGTFDDARHLGTMRKQAGDEEGTTACIAAPEGMRGIKGFMQRVTAAMETGDLARFGSLRYVFAKKNGTGSTVLSMWNEGSVNISTIFPEQGDVPGQDIEGIERPPQSTRIFDAQIPGSGYGVRSYATKESVSRVMAGFEQRLTPLGWQIAPGSVDPTPPVDADGRPRLDWEPQPDPNLRVFTKNGSLLFITTDVSDGETVANIITMGTRGDAESRQRPPRRPWGGLNPLFEDKGAKPHRAK